ncbi:MAG: tRNA (adenosine(37)-N6)-dimethylallyltransferase MiaA, partial [Flavobacteriales bacterium]
YIEALINGIDQLPGRDEVFRKSLEERLEKEGINSLQDQLRRQDPDAAETIDLQNPVRLIRALEIIQATGQPVSSMRTRSAAPRDFHPILIAVSPDREILYQRIDQRVDKMMQRGLLEEVRQLLPYRHLQALHTVGYSELFSYLDNEISLEAAVALIKQHTRNYAKRQMTWFRNKGNYAWFQPDQLEAIITYIRQQLAG